MKKLTVKHLTTALFLGVTLSISSFATAADVEVSTSSTTGAGTITEFSPGSDIVVRTESASAPVHYVVGDSVTYVDESGSPVDASVIKSGVPVTVHYVKEGDRMIARRVVVKKTTTTTTAPVVEQHRTTTTTTTTK